MAGTILLVGFTSLIASSLGYWVGEQVGEAKDKRAVFRSGTGAIVGWFLATGFLLWINWRFGSANEIRTLSAPLPD